MELADRFYWTKVLLASVMATILGFLRSINLLGGLSSLTLGFALYFPLSDLLGRRFSIDRSSALKIGIGTYFLTWFMAWILMFTLFEAIA